MVTNNGLLRIFWPSDIVKSSAPGILVGWRNSDLDFFVAALLQDVDLRSIENALRSGILFTNSPHPVRNILDRCGHTSLRLLGLVNAVAPLLPTGSEPMILARTHRFSIFPEVSLTEESEANVQVIVFQRPNPERMQYMSLEPIALALKKNVDLTKSPLDPIDAAETNEKNRVQALVEKMRLHTITRYPPTEKDLSLPQVIEQINCSFELNRLLQSNLGLVRRRSRRNLSVSERLEKSAADLWHYVNIALHYFFVEILQPIIIQIFIRGLLAHRLVGEVIVVILGWKFRPNDVALKDISATAQQVDLRLQQFFYSPIQYITLKSRKDDWESITHSHAEYIRFYNSLWLVANDVIIGIAIGSYIISNADPLASQGYELLKDWSLEGLRRGIAWLMVYPAGLKLNNDLARFLGDLFLWVIDYWAGCITILQPTFPHIARFIGFASFAGASMPLALFSDLISISTLHVHCFYTASARIYAWQLSIIISLFHLFRGKKRNVLRNRIDSCDYELDQLLLGTILFTLLFFLLPTVVIFYFTFALARMGIISIKAFLDTMLAGLNHFPLFALMLRLKDSGRLPGGVCFELKDNTTLFPNNQSTSPTKVSNILLRSTPLPIGAIFQEYSSFGNRIRKHYLSTDVFLRFATGGFVPPLHRKNLYGLQYSMLPAKRVGILELWERLKQQAEPSISSSTSEKSGVNGAFR